MKTRFHIIPICCLLMITTSPANPATIVRDVKWTELGMLVTNQKATVILSGMMRVQGTITAVGPDSASLKITRTSDRKVYPPGTTVIPRKEILEVRMTSVKGYARVIGAAGAGAAVALGASRWAISDSRVNVSDRSRVAQWAGLTLGVAVGGYFIGRALDTRTTILRIVP